MKSKIFFSLLFFAGVLCLFQEQTIIAQSSNKSPASYVIKPGISVGKISIGMLRDKVISLVGEPISSLDDGDQFSGFTVHYDDDRVVEIIVFSSQYRTAEGMSVKNTPEQFLKIYSKSKITCYSDEGASLITTGRILDEVEKGIAFDRQTVEGRSREIVFTISVHRADTPAKIYGEIKPCKK